MMISSIACCVLALTSLSSSSQPPSHSLTLNSVISSSQRPTEAGQSAWINKNQSIFITILFVEICCRKSKCRFALSTGQLPRNKVTLHIDCFDGIVKSNKWEFLMETDKGCSFFFFSFFFFENRSIFGKLAEHNNNSVQQDGKDKGKHSPVGTNFIILKITYTPK